MHTTSAAHAASLFSTKEISTPPIKVRGGAGADETAADAEADAALASESALQSSPTAGARLPLPFPVCAIVNPSLS